MEELIGGAMILGIIVAIFWDVTVTLGQFALAGAVVALAAHATLGLALQVRFASARARSRSWETCADLVHVLGLSPLRLGIAPDAGESFLGCSRPTAVRLLGVVDVVVGLGVVAFAPRPMGQSFVFLGRAFHVAPVVEIALVLGAAALAGRRMLREHDVHERFAAQARAELSKLLGAMQAPVERALTSARYAAEAHARARTDLGTHAKPLDVACALPLDPLTAIGQLQTQARRFDDLRANVEAHTPKLHSLRARIHLLDRDLASAPASARARKTTLDLADAASLLDHLASLVAGEARHEALGELEELGRIVDQLEHDVDGACRARAESAPSASRPRAADPHSVLGVAPGASPTELKAAYRKLARRHHPDRGGDPTSFRAVVTAYETLTQAAHP